MATMNKPASDSSDWYQAVIDNFSTIERNLVDKSVVTAKGDLVVASATADPMRLPVGSNNQVLVADNRQASCTRWANGTLSSNSVRATTATSTTSTTYVDLDSMSLGVTLGASDKLLVMFSGTFGDSAEGAFQAFVRILRDSTEIKAVAPRANGNFWSDSVAMLLVEQPGAGTYTYKVQWKTDSGTLRNFDADRQLILVVLPA
jgi:hypothetical protein